MSNFKYISVYKIENKLLSLGHKFWKDSCKWKESVISSQKFYWRCGQCGNTVYTTYSEIKNDRCINCRVNLKYEDIYNFIKEKGSILLTTNKNYFGVKNKITYLCTNCNKEHSINPKGILSLSRLPLCSECSEKIRKINSAEANRTEESKLKRKNTSLKIFGVEFPMQSNIVQQSKINTCLNKYGVEYVSQLENHQEKCINTCIDKYGVPYYSQTEEWKNKSTLTLLKNYNVPNAAYLTPVASKQSQDLFWELYKQLSEQEKEKSYFATLNKEFVLCFENKYYKYDFVNSLLKKAIEFNGQKFHPLSSMKDDEINWCVFHPNKTVKEAREYEKHKYLALEKRNYKILTIWDFEFKQNKNEIIKKCLEFLKIK